MAPGDPLNASAPVQAPGDERVEEGVALCLSGGGYRAMLFHVGALWRLNELGYLAKLDRFSSVSGGSITAATLGLHWSMLGFTANGVAEQYVSQVVTPIRALASVTIDQGAVLGGIFTPRTTISDKVAAAYRRHLFGNATLQDLPDEPRFVLNATNLQTGVLWRFSKPYMADYTIGMVPSPKVGLALAVASSSAFPPVLSPARLPLDPDEFALGDRGPNFKPPFTTMAILSDGGVYDNLGLETAWKRYRTILVSDGGGQMAAEGKVATDWARQAVRVNAVIDNQVRDLRKRQAIAGYSRGDRNGAYWGIRSNIGNFRPAGGTLPCDPVRTSVLAATQTRLKAMDDGLQQRLINWGYAVTDAAMRQWVVIGPDVSQAAFPYPIGIG